jgi:carbamoylphosphate synthase large subunit
MKALVIGCTRNIGIIIARALASAGYEVIGIDDRPMPLGLNTRHAARCEHYQAGNEDEEYRAIERLVLRHCPATVVPGRLTALLAKHAAKLETHANVLLPAAHSHTRLTDKLELYELCYQLGIPAARPLSLQEAVAILAARAPGAGRRTVVVKPRSDIGAGTGVVMVCEAEQVESTVREIARTFGPAYISEFVPGPRENVVAINLLFDLESRLVDYFAFRKMRLYPPDKGVTAMARSIHATELVRRILPIFEALEWRGPADAEFKIDERSGEPVLLEINGRFSGALAFSIGCGINFPALLCEAAARKGRKSDLTPRYPEGVIYWNPYLFVKGIWQDWLESGYRWSTVSAALSLAAGKKVGNPWRLDDPAPLFGKLLINCKDFWTRRMSRS